MADYGFSNLADISCLNSFSLLANVSAMINGNIRVASPCTYNKYHSLFIIFIFNKLI
jgi:hypothetical protein